jgi:hypothetical protein
MKTKALNPVNILILILFMLLPLYGKAHPGIGIVSDSKGNIYYTDLQRVWKISSGKRTVAVPDVHTHELFVDSRDNLYGEHVLYEGESTNRFYHYLWVLRPSGKLDTLVGLRQAYVNHDYSLARDKKGNEYFTRQFSGNDKDTNHLYRKYPDGREVIFATGNFRGVRWLHPQEDGSVLYVKDNSVNRVDAGGKVTCIARNVARAKPAFKFSGNSITLWGAWTDNKSNVYVAVFSDQAVKKIDPKGKVSVFYTSKGSWAPNHGVFDSHGTLWLLESSDNNEILVTGVRQPEQSGFLPGRTGRYAYAGGGILLAGILCFLLWKKSR